MGVIPGAPHVAREGPGAGHQWRKATRRKGDGGKPADTHDRTHKGVTPPPRYEPGEGCVPRNSRHASVCVYGGITAGLNHERLLRPRQRLGMGDPPRTAAQRRWRAQPTRLALVQARSSAAPSSGGTARRTEMQSSPEARPRRCGGTRSGGRRGKAAPLAAASAAAARSAPRLRRPGAESCAGCAPHVGCERRACRERPAQAAAAASAAAAAAPVAAARSASRLSRPGADAGAGCALLGCVRCAGRAASPAAAAASRRATARGAVAASWRGAEGAAMEQMQAAAMTALSRRAIARETVAVSRWQAEGAMSAAQARRAATAAGRAATGTPAATARARSRRARA
jgi:hypothetical protein